MKYLSFFLLVMSTTFEVFIEFVTVIVSVLCLISWPWGMWDICSPTRGGTCTPCAGKQHLSHRSPGKSPRYLSDHNERESEVSNKRKTRQATDTIDGKQHILTKLPGQRSSHKRNLKLFRDGTLAVVRTQCVRCWKPRFSPWSGNSDPANTT